MPAPAPIVGRSASAVATSVGRSTQPYTGGTGKGGGVAAAEFGLPDVFLLSAETRKVWQRATDEMAAGEMGHKTVAICQAFVDAAAIAHRQLMDLHGAVYHAANDAAVVGHSSRYLNR